MDVRETVQRVIRGYHEHDILTFASAIGLRVLFAAIPLALFGLGLAGGLGLDEQWTGEWAGRVKESVSLPVFQVVNDTVQRVLGERQVFWMTLGGALAIWEISSGTRAVMDVFDRIYGSRRQRSFGERLRVSLLLGFVVAVLLLTAVACVTLGDDALRALGVLLAAIALLVAYAPTDRPPRRWVTTGSALVVVAWLGTSAALGWYVTSVADYGSIFGALATVWIVLTYIYLAAIAFLTGAEVDTVLREQAG
jgi:membrane protein